MGKACLQFVGSQETMIKAKLSLGFGVHIKHSLEKFRKPDMVAQTCNPDTWEAEAKGTPKAILSRCLAD